MNKFLKVNNIKSHSSISDYHFSMDMGSDRRGREGINKKSSRISFRNDSIITVLNKNHSKLQEEDHNSYDYGRLIATIAKTK